MGSISGANAKANYLTKTALGDEPKQRVSKCLMALETTRFGGWKVGASPKMRSKILTIAMLITTVATPSAAVAEPTYEVNKATENEIKIVKSVKTEINTYALPTTEETAEKQIEKYVKKLEEEKRKANEAEAKREAKEEAAKKVAVKRVARVVSSNVAVPGSNACVVAMKKVFPEHLWRTGYAIMMAESSARPNAIGGPNYNGTYDYGCWQINNTSRALNPDVGAQIAWYKYNHSGWSPWVAWKNGKHLRFM